MASRPVCSHARPSPFILCSERDGRAVEYVGGLLEAPIQLLAFTGYGGVATGLLGYAIAAWRKLCGQMGIRAFEPSASRFMRSSRRMAISRGNPCLAMVNGEGRHPRRPCIHSAKTLFTSQQTPRCAMMKPQARGGGLDLFAEHDDFIFRFWVGDDPMTAMIPSAPSGALFIVSAPSGAGKTTLVRLLMERDPQIHHSVSYTTRPSRPNEIDGQDYHFIDIATFLAMRERGDFLEWAEVHGNFYGTSRAWLTAELAAGRDVLLEIDWQGAQQVRALFPQAVSIFILPPSLTELERRLRARGQDSEEVIQRRLAAALGEMRHVAEFDFVIINNDLQEALGDLLAAVRASRLSFARQRARHPDVFHFLSSL